MQSERLTKLFEFLENDKNDPFNWYAIACEYLSAHPGEAVKYFDHFLEIRTIWSSFQIAYNLKF
jgi:hypothetical protein